MPKSASSCNGPIICRTAIDIIDIARPAPLMIPFKNENFLSSNVILLLNEYKIYTL